LNPTERFSGRATAYVAARPSYPAESIDVTLAGLGDPTSLTVVDIGAGTGISSRLIAARGAFCIALEPNAEMRAAATPGERVRWVNGTAEATTLAAGSVDVVAAFQAWHWVDHPAAVAEARRILKPGGRMAAIYNERDESDPFTAGFGAIFRRYATDATEDRRAAALRDFASIDPAHTQRFSFGNVQLLDRAGAHRRVESSSYLPQTGEAAEAMHLEIDDLCTRFERSDGGVAMQLVTIVVRVDG
jgi:SAM-dependent methyltransferase